MGNYEFWTSISAIIRNGFDGEGLKKLEEYAKQFINGQLLFKRYTEDEQFGCAVGDTLQVIASIRAGGETPANQLTAPEHSFKTEQQHATAQAIVIEQWAKAIGCWTDNVDTEFENIFGMQLAEGGEAHVYDNGASIVKRIGLDYFVLPMLALDRITLHNTLFPSTKMTVIGFGATSSGEFQILVQQQFIHGSLVPEAEIKEYVESLGFKLINPKNCTYATPYLYLSDMHDENVIKTPKGNILVVDCDIRINTPELRCGGIRTLTNDVRFKLDGITS